MKKKKNDKSEDLQILYQILCLPEIIKLLEEKTGEKYEAHLFGLYKQQKTKKA